MEYNAIRGYPSHETPDSGSCIQATHWFSKPPSQVQNVSDGVANPVKLREQNLRLLRIQISGMPGISNMPDKIELK